MLANKFLLQRKYARLIAAFGKRKNIPLREAMSVFYNSQTYRDMREGISDLHCRSDEYLLTELENEMAFTPGGA